ncbi:MAG: hypothetical protein WBP08_02195 [Saprospiraceae bacterium]
MYRLGRSGQYQDNDAQSHIAYGNSALIHHLDQMRKTISVTRWALLGQPKKNYYETDVFIFIGTFLFHIM